MNATTVGHDQLANAIRFLAADAVQKAKSGHPGMPMGMADVATVLFGRHMKFDAAAPRWADRDRFVLSAGHGSMLLYALGYLLGYEDVTLDEIKNFRQLTAKTAGHPEFGHISCAETTTGPLGQGITSAVGMALAEKMLAARHGPGLVDHRTWVIAGDGCLMEGVSQEAIEFAGHQRLGKLIVFWDDNGISIDGKVDLACSTDQLKRFEAANWHVTSIDGHDPAAIDAAIAAAKASPLPSLIDCRTTIGFGAPTLAGSEKTHGAPLGEEEIAGAREKLGWPHPAFEVPERVLGVWRAAGTAGAEARAAWEGRLAALPADERAAFEHRLHGDLPAGLGGVFDAFRARVAADKPKVATRKASEMVLTEIVGHLPGLVGGSADLSHSNLTITATMRDVTADDASGNYVRYGIREHGMAAIMNGLALHGGFIPYGGTFLVFSDYARPGMRLSALMGVRVVYVMTHDSIGLGEDGPTHQPIEHLPSLRAMPGMWVFRPCDAVETAECWQLALERRDGPSTLALSRQGLPTLRAHTAENLSARGGYILAEAEGTRQVTLIATGSEVEIAVKARDLLKEKGIAAAVVSLPSWELFEAQSSEYRGAVLGEGVPRVAVEAASTFGWERYVGPDGTVVGMTGFGASAPGAALYEFFGITPAAVADAAAACVERIA